MSTRCTNQRRPFNPQLIELERGACLLDQAVGIGAAGVDGGFEVFEGTFFLAQHGSGTGKGVVGAGDEYLFDELLAAAPVLGEANVMFGLGHVAGLLVAGGGEQRKLGAVGVVLQGVAVELDEALPIAKLPLGAGTF